MLVSLYLQAHLSICRVTAYLDDELSYFTVSLSGHVLCTRSCTVLLLHITFNDPIVGIPQTQVIQRPASRPSQAKGSNHVGKQVVMGVFLMYYRRHFGSNSLSDLTIRTFLQCTTAGMSALITAENSQLTVRPEGYLACQSRILKNVANLNIIQ